MRYRFIMPSITYIYIHLMTINIYTSIDYLVQSRLFSASSPAAALLFVVGHVLNDVERVGLPNGHRHVDVLLNRHRDLLDHLVGTLDGHWNLPDDLNRHLSHNLIRHWPFHFYVLCLVDWVRHVLHNINVDGVRLRYWHLYLVRNRNRYGLWYSDLHVTGHFNGHAADHVLYDRLELVSSLMSDGAANCDGSADDSWSSNSCSDGSSGARGKTGRKYRARE